MDLCVIYTAAGGTENGKDAITNRSAYAEKKSKILLKTTKKKTEQTHKQIFAKYFSSLERNDFCDFKRKHERAYQKKKIMFTEQRKKKINGNKVVDESGLQNKMKFFGIHLTLVFPDFGLSGQ